jgi:UDP-perosamine 4-acetyltransferase
MTSKPVIIIGTGTEAKMMADVLAQCDIVVYGFLVPDKRKTEDEWNDVPVLGALENKEYHATLKNEKTDYAIASEAPEMRRALLKALFDLTGRLPQTVVAPSATISPYAKIEAGNAVYPGAVVAPNSELGPLNIVGAGALIESEVRVAGFANIGWGAKIGRGAFVNEEAYIGAGAVVFPGVRIGKKAVVMPGAVVTEDLGDEQKTRR